MKWYHAMQSCSGKRHCQDVYARLGRSEGPSVTGPVLLAFGIPILVFLSALLGFELITSNVIPNNGHRMLAALAVASIVTSLTVLAIKHITRREVDGDQ